MMPARAVDAIRDALRAAGESPSLVDVGARSRIGKGSCQGAFCALRAVAHLYRQREFDGTRGLSEMCDFLGERWRSERAVLWGAQLAQAELAEAIHCGLFDEELAAPADSQAVDGEIR
jgi:glycerol-3-phosphate dehydrogenase